MSQLFYHLSSSMHRKWSHMATLVPLSETLVASEFSASHKPHFSRNSASLQKQNSLSLACQLGRKHSTSLPLSWPLIKLQNLWCIQVADSFSWRVLESKIRSATSQYKNRQRDVCTLDHICSQEGNSDNVSRVISCITISSGFALDNYFSIKRYSFKRFRSGMDFCCFCCAAYPRTFPKKI